MPRPAVKEARRSVHTRLWRAGSRRTGAFEGGGGRLPRPRHHHGATWPWGRACTASHLNFLITKARLFVHSFIHSICAYESKPSRDQTRYSIQCYGGGGDPDLRRSPWQGTGHTAVRSPPAHDLRQTATQPEPLPLAGSRNFLGVSEPQLAQLSNGNSDQTRLPGLLAELSKPMGKGTRVTGRGLTPDEHSENAGVQ